MRPELLYSTPFFVSAILIFTVAILAFIRRRVRGGEYLAAVCVGGALWAASEGALYLGLDLETNLAIIYTQFAFITPLPPLALIFTLTLFGTERWITPMAAFLFTMAAGVVLLAWTNPLHQLVYTGYYLIEGGPIPMIGVETGPAWWGIIGYHYLLLSILGAVLLQKVITSAGLRRAQAALILVSVVILWLLNAVYVTGNSPVPNMDIGPLAFILMAVSMAWGFFRYNLLEILPIAQEEIFNGLNEPVLVLDDKNRILAINPAAAAVLAIDAARSVGLSIDESLDGHSLLAHLPGENGTSEMRIGVDDQERCFEVRVSALYDRKALQLGRTVVLQDITQRKRTDAVKHESERLQGVLEMAGIVCHDLSQPLMALLGYSDLVALELPRDDALGLKLTKLTEQIQRLNDISQKLMRITRYETRNYLDSKIIDIDKSAETIAADRQRPCTLH